MCKLIFQVKPYFISDSVLLFVCGRHERNLILFSAGGAYFNGQLLKQLRGRHQYQLEYVLSSAVSTCTDFSFAS